MGDKLTDRMRDAGKVQADPALGAIQELSDTVAASFEVLEADSKKAREEAKTIAADLKGDVEKTRTEMAAGFKVHADRINALDRRSIALGIGGGLSVEGVCLAAMDDDDKKIIPEMDWSMPRNDRNRENLPLLSNPVGRSLVANWLHKSLLLQKRRFHSKEQEAKAYEALERYEKALSDAFPGMQKAAALITTTTTLGGHWIPDPVAAELYRLILDNSVIGSQCTHVPMNAITLDLPTEGSSSLSVTWGTEATAITDSVPASNAVNKVTLTAKRLNGRAQSSIEQMQDSPVSVLGWVQSKLTELCGREIDAQFLEGDGTVFTGLVGDANVNAITTDGANGTAITYANLVKLVFKARERASREGARFYCAPEIMAKIIGLVDTTGQPVVQFGNVPNAMATSILGFPAECHSVIGAARTYGTGTALSNVYFGPPRQLVLGDRMGMSWDVTDQPNFTAAIVDMRLITRVACGIAVPKAFSRMAYCATT